MGAAIGRVSVAEVVSAGSGTMIDGNTMYYGGRDKEMDGKFFFFFVIGYVLYIIIIPVQGTIHPEKLENYSICF